MMTQLLELHLSRTIARTTMTESKFAQRSTRLKNLRAKFNAELEDLDKEMDSVETDSNDVVAEHRAQIGVLKDGVKEMREMVEEMKGNGEEDEVKVATFPDGQKTGEVG